MATITIIPLDYDYEWIMSKAGTKAYGVSEEEDGFHIHYNKESFESVSSELENYKINYLLIAVPSAIQKVTDLRKEKILKFNFNGLELNLDYETESRITGAVVFLDKNPDIKYLNWDLGMGNFMQIDKDTLYALATATGKYVQGCFNHSKYLIDSIKESKDLDDLNAIDIESGWPN